MSANFSETCCIYRDKCKKLWLLWAFRFFHHWSLICANLHYDFCNQRLKIHDYRQNRRQAQFQNIVWCHTWHVFSCTIEARHYFLSSRKKFSMRIHLLNTFEFSGLWLFAIAVKCIMRVPEDFTGSLENLNSEIIPNSLSCFHQN